MIRAIALKELREISVFAGLGLLAFLLVATAHMGLNPLWPSARLYYPFLGDGFRFQFGLVAVSLATAIGLWQSIGDQWGGAHLFLQHRPVSRRQLVGAKLALGLVAYLAVAAVPIVIYAAWARTPGSFAGPFFWSMTSETWQTWAAGAAVYLGAFVSGLRPASWFGTRLAPLAAALIVVFPLAMFRWLVFLPSLLVACAALISVALFVARERECG
jgi:hypothetical protein